MTQQQLADLLFIYDKAISKCERRISLPYVTISEKIAKIFDVSIAELIKGSKFPESRRYAVHVNRSEYLI